jgi:phosphonate metabolism-associated iron-containing alcohol dehydrogenase
MVREIKGADMQYQFHNPVHVHFGVGTLNRLKEILNGRNAYLVTFPEARQFGLIGKLEKLLGEQLVGVEENVFPNPDVSNLSDSYQNFWARHAQTDVILALGGGSAIDTAKSFMVGTQSGKFDELIDLLSKGSSFKPHATKSLIAIPTTAGTGSEVTPWATIWDKAKGKKYSLHLPETWPEAAIIDPGLMLSLPASVTLQSGLDALSHALESIWNRNANPISDTFGVSAAKGVMNVLPSLMADQKNIQLRSDMALAALKAGMAFSNTKTALAHSISYDMTLQYGVPHGIACSFTLPMVLKKAIGCSQERDQVLSEIFDCDISEAPQFLMDFLKKLGVKTDFKDYGVANTEADQMILKALDGVRGKNFIGAN